jgi:hypothetical protein
VGLAHDQNVNIQEGSHKTNWEVSIAIRPEPAQSEMCQSTLALPQTKENLPIAIADSVLLSIRIQTYNA